MLGGLAAFAAIVVFVMAHEAGHFFAAKLTGMKATEFFFGFGPRLWSVKRGETEYGIKAIPFGGYVRIAGMNALEEVNPADFGRTYREKKFWQKSVVVMSGVAMNFVIAYIMFFGLLVYEGIQVPSTEISLVLEELDDGSPAPSAVAGLQPGDVIVELAGTPVAEWEDAAQAIAAHPDQPVTIVVDRDGTRVSLETTLATRADPETGTEIGYLGVSPLTVTREVGVLTGLGLAGRAVGDSMQLTFEFLGRIVQPSSLARLGAALIGNTDAVPDEIRPVSPIGLVQIGSQAERIGVTNFLWLLASINIILGLLNGLPLYPLDGGHFAVALYERVSGREVDIRKLLPVAAAVIALVVFLGLVGIVLDIFDPLQIPG